MVRRTPRATRTDTLFADTTLCRARRRSALLNALVETGLMPADAKDAKALAVCDPDSLRKRALDERLEPYEIGRALFHLNQRRGFKSNRKAERKSGDEKESGKIATGELGRAHV